MDERDDIAMIRAPIGEGEASGIVDAQPEGLVKDIMAQCPASDRP